MFKIFQIMGPPGSGKGTQAKMLQKKFNLEYIGSGDLLRSRAKKNDFTGRKLKRELASGKRIHTPIIFKIWMDELESFKQKKNLRGFILDGSPRTLHEAELLDLALDWYEWKKQRQVFFVDISPRESINRLTKRRVCSRCGDIVSINSDPTARMICSKCGGRLLVRADDNSMRDMRERLKWFKTDVLPAINYYRKKGELVRINGAQSIEKVSADIQKALKAK